MRRNKYSFGKIVSLSILSILVPIAGLAIIFEVFLRFLPVQSATRRLDVDAIQPIAKFQPNREITYSIDWNMKNVVHHRINNDGFANRQDYFINPKPTVAIIGDSYVEAFGVPYESSFHGLLYNELNENCNVYSFGMSGAPLSQYVAWAKYAKQKFSPSIFVFNIVGNDFDESHDRYDNQPGYWHYRGDYDQEYEYVLTPRKSSLAKRVARHSALARYFFANLKMPNRLQRLAASFSGSKKEEVFVGNKPSRVGDEKLNVSMKVVDRFLDDIANEVELPRNSVIFTVDGLRQTIYGEMARSVSEFSFVGLVRRYFIQEAKLRGFNAIDLHESFLLDYRENKERFESPYDWHWNEYGHAVVYRELAKLDWSLCR